MNKNHDAYCRNLLVALSGWKKLLRRWNLSSQRHTQVAHSYFLLQVHWKFGSVDQLENSERRRAVWCAKKGSLWENVKFIGLSERDPLLTSCKCLLRWFPRKVSHVMRLSSVRVKAPNMGQCLIWDTYQLYPNLSELNNFFQKILLRTLTDIHCLTPRQISTL